MKKVLYSLFLLACFTSLAQQKNSFLDQNFWKASPDLAKVKAEIANGNSPSELNPNAFDPVVLAINNNASYDVIKYLAEQPGNSPSKLTHDSRIYLHWAAYKGNSEVVAYLIGKGSDLHLKDSHGATPIDFAAGSGQLTPAVCDVFFKAGINPKQTYKDGANLLLLSIAMDKNSETTNYFISKGLSLKDKDSKGNTAFDYAARSGDVARLKELLKQGVSYTENALLTAAQGFRRTANTKEVYQYLIEELKLNPNATGSNGENVLHYLVRKDNQQDIITYFLSKGINANHADKDGNSPLMNASSGSNLEVVKLILAKGKNINAVNAKGESALTMAVKSGSAPIAEYLVANGADVKVKDKDGNTLTSYLLQSYREPRNGASEQDDFTAKLKLLQAKGLDLKATQKDNNTLYHLAVVKNELGLLKKIEGFGIDINAQNKEGVTALHKAAMVAKDDSILKYLLSLGAKKGITTEFDETAYDLAKENEYLTKNSVSVEFLK